ncbi:unnamed protein product [Ceutorhynchus assimilis]|uniref:Short-chain dehydrogenase/reductase 3 n=1 Tax=Ceutorhynchus assimilis TaxID=467358 RepID=A0A9P0DGU1_9CUCU|nr:unnamed protein product [Ceutorhynchus assimilis]
MATTEEILHHVKGLAKILFFFLIFLPYTYIESIVNLFLKKEPKSVKGEIVLITGTGHGIGKLLALKYSAEGAIVVGWDINEELNNKTIQELKRSGKQAYGYKVDVANREEVLATAKKVQEMVGEVTILINNAGIMPHHPFLDHTEKEIRKIMDINVMAHFWILEAFLPAMKRNNHGHVVALSSMAGILGLVNLVPYCASKFAVRGLMEGLHEEFRLDNPCNKVRFTTVYPFMVDTGLCKFVDVTYPVVTPMLKPEFVADKIFESQTLEKRNVALPGYINLAVMLKTSFSPEKAANFLSDKFKCNLASDLDRHTKNGHSKNN